MEEWCDITGYAGSYQVSDWGRVWSHYTHCYLKTDVVNGGYHRVTLFNKGKRKRFFIHRLVLETFVGVCPKGMQACHNDGDPDNNRLSNLRWDTCSANNLDKRLHDTHQVGERNGNSKLTSKRVKKINQLLEACVPQRTIATKFKISQSTVSDIKRGHLWSHL